MSHSCSNHKNDERYSSRIRRVNRWSVLYHVPLFVFEGDLSGLHTSV